ncbi:MAG: sigma 54-interacting transcriptional regulator [Deltaproteobacteria bacterium]|jgi:arginine utilization regulatory protein|nr:sigma 54-interacting transcriptional regulator [Deltaproteobacteria bacterium]
MTARKIWTDALSAVTNLDYNRQVFDHYTDGVTIVNARSELVYYNRAQGRIDELEPEQALGKTILDLYRVSDNTNYPTMRCLFSRQPLIDHACYYYTHLGKLINSIHNVFPLLLDSGELAGCVCFIRDYGQISEEFTSAQHRVVSAKTADPTEAKRATYTFHHIITKSPIMRRSLDMASMAANSPSSVMLYGETGCGKEMFAQAIHNISRRHDEPFMALNCAAIPESLLEGIIFGTVKGAFTGATDKAGVMELANNGTIFLDEINSMPYGLQSKILRAVQEQKVRRVGDSKERKVSLKIVSAANVNPHQAVAEGTLRADLLYRLGVVMINIPPLRERPDDIPLLTGHFIKKLNVSLDKNVTGLSGQTQAVFRRYLWPGNVRELEHALEGAMNLVPGHIRVLEPEHFSASLIGDWFAGAPSRVAPVGATALAPVPVEAPYSYADRQKFEIEKLIEALELSNGNAAKAARSLNISPQLMSYKIKKYGLKKKARVEVEK